MKQITGLKVLGGNRLTASGGAWVKRRQLSGRKKFAWRDVLKTLDDSTGVKAADTKAVIQDR